MFGRICQVGGDVEEGGGVENSERIGLGGEVLGFVVDRVKLVVCLLHN